MADFPTRPDLFRVGRDKILSIQRRLSAAAVEREGTDVNLLIAAGSAMADACVGQLIVVCAGLYLDSAEEIALDRLVFDRYGLVRKPAAPSLGAVRFNTTVANPVAFTIPVGTVLSTNDGTQFVTLVATSFPAGSTGPVYCQVRSLLAGFNQQSKAGTITAIVSSIAGAANDLTVTNDSATAGAADREDDPGLRNRARMFWTTARRGTLAAIEAGALAVPGVVKANAIEVLDASGRPGRWVQLILSDRFTDALATIGATSAGYEAQSQTLAQTVFRALSDVRCGGIFVQCIVAQTILVQFQLNLTFAAGVDYTEVSEMARARIVNYINELSPGDTFVRADAQAALSSITGLILTGNELALPTGDVVPKPVQVLRSSFELALAANSVGQPLAITTDPDALVQVNILQA